MKIDVDAVYIIQTLNDAGYEAFLVGGCVRDFLLGEDPRDWDIATSAKPDEVIAAFPKNHVIPTGIKHGTVTVLVKKNPIEVTTFRSDGKYLDSRRPSEVFFVSNLKEDLSRRDFTINALAYSLESGVIDYFGGKNDLKAKTLRAVGNPDARFKEDALRILRALRFSSLLNFDIEEKLAAAIHSNKNLLKNIASERIRSELTHLLTGVNVYNILMNYADVFAVFIPEISPMIGFDQKNPHHAYDLWEHTAKATAASENDPLIRLTLLLHDIAKTVTFTTDANGTGHFYKHNLIGSEMAEERLRALKFDGNTIRSAVELIKYHDAEIAGVSDFSKSGEKKLLRWLNKIGEEQLRRLLKIKRGDTLAQAEKYQKARLENLDFMEKGLEKILNEEPCFTIKNLAINGDDLIASGVPEGQKVGAILKTLLEDVMSGQLKNDRSVLIPAAKALRTE